VERPDKQTVSARRQINYCNYPVQPVAFVAIIMTTMTMTTTATAAATVAVSTVNTDSSNDRQQHQQQPVLIPICGTACCSTSSGGNNNNNNNNIDDAIEEWAMIELNGELVVPPPLQEEGAAANDGGGGKGKENPAGNDPSGGSDCDGGVELGSVKVVDATTVQMVLGNHQLTGTVETLKQPFCVLHKKTKERDGERDIGVGGSGGVQYEIAGIVTKKLLFNQYPKIIMR